MILVGAACGWPAPLRSDARRSAIDDVLPAWHFVEHHETLVRATPERIFSELWRVTADEIRFFRTLTWIRNPRIRSHPESVLAAPTSRPILDVALAGGFSKAIDLPPRELVLSVHVARDVTAAMNFLVEPVAHGESRVSTETRVYARTPASLRAFRAYWRAIYPGSSLIRYEWLAAIKRRAEQ